MMLKTSLKKLIFTVGSDDDPNPLDQFEVDNQPLEAPPADSLRRSNTDKRPSIWLTDYVTAIATTAHQNPHSINNSISCDTIHHNYKNYLTAFSAIEESRNFVEASKDKRLVGAMKTEIQALEDNGTWELVQLLPWKRPIGYKWVYKVKYKADGSIERFKAQLVAKGYNQRKGLDYNKIFTTVRSVIAFATTKNWRIHQMDVYNVFLQRDLHDEVYIQLLEGFTI